MAFVVGSDVTAWRDRARGRGGGVIESGRAGVVGGARWCTVGILSSGSAPEEPITARENRLVIGLDPEPVASRGGGEAARALYTG